MNFHPAEIFAYSMTALGSGGAVATVALAWINRKPKGVTNAEARAAMSASQFSLAGAFEKLVTDLQEEIARKDGEITAMRTDLHRLRNRVLAMQSFGGALLKHIDVLEEEIVWLGGTPPARPMIPDPT